MKKNIFFKMVYYLHIFDIIDIYLGGIRMSAYEKYDDDFKKKVIEQVNKGYRVADVARRYNISAPNVRYWIQKEKEKQAKEAKEDINAC